MLKFLEKIDSQIGAAREGHAVNCGFVTTGTSTVKADFFKRTTFLSSRVDTVVNLLSAIRFDETTASSLQGFQDGLNIHVVAPSNRVVIDAFLGLDLLDIQEQKQEHQGVYLLHDLSRQLKKVSVKGASKLIMVMSQTNLAITLKNGDATLGEVSCPGSSANVPIVSLQENEYSFHFKTLSEEFSRILNNMSRVFKIDIDCKAHRINFLSVGTTSVITLGLQLQAEDSRIIMGDPTMSNYSACFKKHDFLHALRLCKYHEFVKLGFSSMSPMLILFEVNDWIDQSDYEPSSVSVFISSSVAEE